MARLVYKWYAGERAQLRYFWAKYPTYAIAYKLGRSLNSVLGKASYLGLPRKDNPSRPRRPRHKYIKISERAKMRSTLTVVLTTRELETEARQFARSKLEVGDPHLQILTDPIQLLGQYLAGHAVWVYEQASDELVEAAFRAQGRPYLVSGSPLRNRNLPRNPG